MKLSIIMYHYVRRLRYSRFPGIKGLETSQFREQIAYINRNFSVISGDRLLSAAVAGALRELPPRSLLLTFDDGYIDHFTEVFPILVREKLSGCFFPPVKCVVDNQVLEVNKIHFILASVPDKRKIVNYVFESLREHGPQFQTQSPEYYWMTLAVADRFDPREVVFIKQVLQRELPDDLRQIIINGLFEKYVTSDEASFARELYINVDQIRCMRDSGMYLGSHGYAHYWLDRMAPAAQRQEVKRALEFLQLVGTPIDSWIMCYPFGAYNESLISILRDRGCKIGLTTRVGIADLDRDNLLTLPRLDTNDLPKDATAAPNEWTLKQYDKGSVRQL